MKKLYVKSEQTFALVFIAIYCVSQSLANPLSRAVGVEGSFHAVFSIALTALLFFFIKNNGLLERYGLCRSSVPARKYFWYLPLVLLAVGSLWNGAAMNFPLVDTVCYLCSMLCVGFLEEVLFRGLVFGNLRRKSAAVGYLFSCLLFALLHEWQFAVVNRDITYFLLMLQYLVPGLVLAWVYDRTGTLWTSIGLHAAANALSAWTLVA